MGCKRTECEQHGAMVPPFSTLSGLALLQAVLLAGECCESNFVSCGYCEDDGDI